MTLSWLFMAISAAGLWGITYSLAGWVLHEQKISPSFMLLVAISVSTPFYWLYSYMNGSLQTGIEHLKTSPKAFLLLVGIGLIYVVANILIFKTVAYKNASMAAAIESTYPAFTILFSWLIFQRLDLTLYGYIGVTLIILGVSLLAFNG